MALLHTAQLEVALEVKHAECTAMEMELSSAFSEVVRELQARVNKLTAERDQRLIERERAGGRRGNR